MRNPPVEENNIWYQTVKGQKGVWWAGDWRHITSDKSKPFKRPDQKHIPFLIFMLRTGVNTSTTLCTSTGNHLFESFLKTRLKREKRSRWRTFFSVFWVTVGLNWAALFTFRLCSVIVSKNRLQADFHEIFFRFQAPSVPFFTTQFDTYQHFEEKRWKFREEFIKQLLLTVCRRNLK